MNAQGFSMLMTALPVLDESMGFQCHVWNMLWVLNFFQKHLRSRVLHTDYVCKVVDQEQEWFNFG